MEAFRLMNEYTDNLCNAGHGSFKDLSELKRNGILDHDFNELGIKEKLKRDFNIFLDIMFDDNNYYYNKALTLEKTLTPELKYLSEYALALHLDKPNIYGNFPLLLKTIIEDTNIEYFKGLNINDIKAKSYYYLDIKDSINENRIYSRVNIKKVTNYLQYNKYGDIEIKDLNVYDKNQFFVWSEKYTYELLKGPSTAWISRYYGDGYGFDIYSFDDKLFREKLIEVKSGMNNYFTLTENEVSVMRNSFYKNADYYIYKYTYNKSDNQIYPTILKYDKELDALVCDDKVFEIEKQENNYFVNLSDQKVKTLKR